MIPAHPNHDIELAVIRALCVECDVARPIDRESRLVEDLGLDSLTLLTLLVELEDQLRIALDVDTMSPPATVGELCDLIAATLPARPRAPAPRARQRAGEGA